MRKIWTPSLLWKFWGLNLTTRRSNLVSFIFFLQVEPFFHGFKWRWYPNEWNYPGICINSYNRHIIINIHFNMKFWQKISTSSKFIPFLKKKKLGKFKRTYTECSLKKNTFLNMFVEKYLMVHITEGIFIKPAQSQKPYSIVLLS